VNGAVQRSEMTYPAIEAGMVENQTVTTIKLNTTQFQQIDKSQFKKVPEFAQISGYINTPNNNSPFTLSNDKCSNGDNINGIRFFSWQKYCKKK
jgi:hypothetical protein